MSAAYIQKKIAGQDECRRMRWKNRASGAGAAALSRKLERLHADFIMQAPHTLWEPACNAQSVVLVLSHSLLTDPTIVKQESSHI